MEKIIVFSAPDKQNEAAKETAMQYARLSKEEADRSDGQAARASEEADRAKGYADRIDLGVLDAAVLSTGTDAETALLAKLAAEQAATDAANDANAQITPNVSAAVAAKNAAETAKALSEAAALAAVNSNWTYTVEDNAALLALTGMTPNQTAFVKATEHQWKYESGAWVDKGKSVVANKVDDAAVLPIASALSDWSPIILSKTDGHYVRFSDGALEANASFNAFSCSVQAGDVLEITNGLNAGAVAAATAAFVDADGALVEALWQGQAGGAVSIVAAKIRVPKRAATLRLSRGSSATPPLVQKASVVQAAAELRSVQSVASGHDVELDRLRSWAAVEPQSVTASSYIAYDTGNVVSLSGFTLYRFDVPEGAASVRLTAQVTGNVIALAVFKDAEGNYLGYYLRQTTSVLNSYDEEILPLPIGTARVYVSKPSAGIVPLFEVRGLFAPILSKLDDIPVIQSDVARHDAELLNLRAWIKANPASITSGAYIAYATGVITTVSGYEVQRFDVPAGLSDARVSAQATGGATALAVFKDAADGYLGYYLHQTTGVTNTYVNEVLPLPSGTAQIYITKITSAPAPVLEFYGPDSTISEKIADAVKTSRIARAAGGEYWSGKTGVWFGTSIPAGGAVHKYPEKVAGALGMTITNEAVGSSSVRAGVRSLVSGIDPYGWTGRAFEAVSRALMGGHAEKQYLYDNWDSWKTKLTGAPSTVSASDLAAWKGYSYETRLARHLGEGNRKDVYFIDHGVNDYGMTNDVVTAGVGSRDRYTFLGAMNAMIDLILADNPKARIILIGHYESQLRPTITQAQQIVSDYWSLPICPLWQRLAWSQQIVQTRGEWVSGVWVPDHHATAVSKTLTQIWMPDNLHPHQDLSGGAINRISEVIAGWLSSVR